MHPTRVAITGATGQLGSALINRAPDNWLTFPVTRADADLADWPAVRSALANANPDVVIHAAANTDVDGCEEQPENAFRLNASGTRYAAQATAELGAIFVYVSTNFVFNGTKSGSYHEFDIPDPINIYGQSKLAGEIEAMATGRPTYVIRTAQIFDETGHNFVNTMLKIMSNNDRISVVADQYGNPTYAIDLADAIFSVLHKAPPGVYHLTNNGAASWYEWAVQIAQCVESNVEVAPVPGSSYVRSAQPPENGTLTSLLLPDLGIQLPDWKDALRRCLSK